MHKIVFSKLDGVKKITLDYSKINVAGQHAIGEHFLTAEVQQQKAGSVLAHCYQLKYTVHDVDECTNTDKSKGMKWVSQCDSSAVSWSHACATKRARAGKATKCPPLGTT